MSLATKALLVLGAMTAALLLLLDVLQGRIVRAGFAQIEEGAAHDSAEQVLRAIEGRARDLGVVATDWGAWDEMYAFAQDRHQAFADANLTAESLRSCKASLLAVVDRTGALAGGVALDPQTSVAGPVPSSLLRLVAAPGAPLAGAAPGREAVTGVLVIDGAPMLVAARPILSSRGEGPSRGTVILGRPLDQTAIQRLAEDLCLSVYAFRPEALASRPVARAAFAEIAGADATTVRVLDAATVAGYGVVYDLQALPALLIEAQTPRDIYGQGLHISNAFTVLLLVAGGAFLLAVALLQRVTVISRLEHLSREVDAVAVADDCAKAVSLAGTDELAALARNINRMLERLAASRRALADSEARYRRLFDAVPVGLFSTTPDGQRLDGNQAMMEVLGCATRESYLKGKSVGAYVRAQDRQHWHDLIRTHGSVRDCEVLLQRHDGALVWGLLSVTAVRDETGQVVAHEGSFVDITARKAAEDALRQSEERFQQVAQSVADWVWEIDPSGLYTYASRAVERILGYRAEEVVRTKWFRDLLAPAAADARNRVLLEAMERRERIRSQVCAGVHRDGRVVLLETSATPVLDATGGFLGYRGAGTDVTERRQAEERQAQLEMHLQQQQRMAAVGMLASGVAHQISNPVFGIMNYALLVSEGIEEGHPLREYAGEIVRECRRVADTVSSLLAFSQPEEKGTSLARVADIVGALLSLVQAAVCRDQIALQVAVPEDLPMVRCRSAQIQHVLMSLLTNAREALNARYPGHDPDKVIRVTAGVVAKDGRTWVRTTVEDHGPGIPVADRSRVFEPFFTTKDRATSAGLGLAVSHGIVKAAGGLLHFESEVDRYTRFHVDLPACADLDEGDAAATPAGASGSSA